MQSRPLRLPAGAATIATVWLVMLCVPALTASEYWLDTGIAIATFAVLSTGLNVIYGYVGLLSFAQVAFFGIGGYAAALLVTRLGWPFWPALPAAAIVATLAGLLIGYSSLRLSRHAFAIVSLSFALLCGIVARDWVALTRGSMGIPGLSLPGFDAPAAMYRLTVTVAVILLLGFHGLLSSRLGRAFQAIRLNEPLAQSQGIDPLRYKLLAIAASAAASGVMGALFVFHLTIVDPSVFDFYYTETMLIMVILGGAGSFWGVIAASAVFSVVPDLLRFSSDLRLMLYGLVLVAAMLFCPGGFAGLLRQRSLLCWRLRR